MIRGSPVPTSAVLLAVAMFLALAAGNILTSLLPQIQDEFAITYAVAGLLVSAFGFARLLLDLPAGLLQERFGSRTLSAAGFALLIGGSLLATVAPAFAALVAGRVAMGLGPVKGRGATPVKSTGGAAGVASWARAAGWFAVKSIPAEMTVARTARARRQERGECIGSSSRVGKQ